MQNSTTNDNSISDIGDRLKTRVFVLTGPSQTGKHSLAIKLQNDYPDLVRRVVPHTTRNSKPLEMPGVDYHFVNTRKMKLMIQKGMLMEYMYIGK